MKFIGIFLIFFSFSLFGFSLGNKYLSMLKDMKRAEIFIKNIILFIKNENLTVEEIFENCISCGDKETKKFLSELRDSHDGNISFLAEKSGFSKNKTVNLLLEEVFYVLGKYSSEEQIKEFEFCRSKIKNLFEKEEKDFTDRAKLCRNLGILSGLFVSIMII